MKPYYEHGGQTIYCADWRELELPKCDLLLTDPPYGIGAARKTGFGNGVKDVSKSGNLKGNRVIASKYAEMDWDDDPPSSIDITAMRRLCKIAIIFGGNYFELPPSRCWLLWDKINGQSDFADAEMAWTNMDRAVRVFRYLWNGMFKEVPEERFHPTQKPLALMKWCITQAPDTVRTVLDPYMGSGTTLVAAKAMGLTGIGVDREESYCEIAAKRLSQEIMNFE